jgi:hypothetical protein
VNPYTFTHELCSTSAAQHVLEWGKLLDDAKEKCRGKRRRWQRPRNRIARKVENESY